LGQDNLHLFLSIAEIAGVFIGFGALISFARDATLDVRSQLLYVVWIGLVVLSAALLPVWLDRFGLADRTLWVSSSAGFLLIIWGSLFIVFRDREFREWNKADVKAHPVRTALYLGCLELPIQASLVLEIFGVFPTLSSAFYVTALVLNLFEAAIYLGRLVLARDSS
jgi:hypothetical protein